MVGRGVSLTDASDEPRFCERCGGPLEERRVGGVYRPYCSPCRRVVFIDPKVAAVVLVRSGGKLVMVRRAIDPALGRWSFPSGYVDRGESVEEAAVREVKEETGLEIRLDGLVGLYSGGGSAVILAAYSATIAGGELTPGEEVTDAALFSPDGLPPLPFPHDDTILRDWRRFVSTPGGGGGLGPERADS